MLIYASLLLVLLLVLLVLMINRKRIKAYLRYKSLITKLPCADQYHAVLGHILLFVGLSPEKIFTKARIWIRGSSPLSVVDVGLRHVVFVAAPEETEAIIGQMKHLNKAFAYKFLQSWLGDGLLTSKSESWHKRRKILTPAFHFSILLQFVDIFNRESVNFCNLIEKTYLNVPVNIEPLASDFALATMSETSMGTKVNLKTKEGVDYKHAIYELGLIVFRRFLTPWFWPRIIFDFTTQRKIEEKDLKILHKFTTNIIQKRSENFAIFDEKFDGTLTKRKYPLLDILLNAKFKDNSIDDVGIRNEVDTFMFEGHDTTATCLSFTIMLLACHKEIQDEVYQEIVSVLGTDLSNQPTYAILQEMSLLERCIKESLRLYPPVSLIGRKTSEETSTKYGTIPKDIHSFVMIYDLHRNPDIWPNPDEFDPSRHLPENCRGRHPFAFIPFSAGPRNCIGQRFAMLEIKAFFCALLRKFILEQVDTPKSLVIIQEVILRTRNGIRVKFKLRQ
ncbi:cytochrome P450 4c3-like isoform X2 [Euwallacea fornicatus]|uniref:cytochrome P450 4c3-like isoform X2 n=1 Tax=Euwallacea fornicatus TaxID=995702 RepID=UPI00338E8CBA